MACMPSSEYKHFILPNVSAVTFDYLIMIVTSGGHALEILLQIITHRSVYTDQYLAISVQMHQ